MTFHEALDRTLQKFVRDFVVNLVAVSPFMYVDGAVDVRLFFPTVGMAFWRTVRDVAPAAWRWFTEADSAD